MGCQDRRCLKRSARGRGRGADSYGSRRPGRDGLVSGQEARDLRLRVIDFKVSALDTNGGPSVSALIDVERGGPARHFHHAQEEWFYVAEGEYIIEVGDGRYELGPGDSVGSGVKLRTLVPIVTTRPPT